MGTLGLNLVGLPLQGNQFLSGHMARQFAEDDTADDYSMYNDGAEDELLQQGITSTKIHSYGRGRPDLRQALVVTRMIVPINESLRRQQYYGCCTNLLAPHVEENAHAHHAGQIGFCLFDRNNPPIQIPNDAALVSYNNPGGLPDDVVPYMFHLQSLEKDTKPGGENFGDQRQTSILIGVGTTTNSGPVTVYAGQRTYFDIHPLMAKVGNRIESAFDEKGRTASDFKVRVMPLDNNSVHTLMRGLQTAFTSLALGRIDQLREACKTGATLHAYIDEKVGSAVTGARLVGNVGAPAHAILKAWALWNFAKLVKLKGGHIRLTTATSSTSERFQLRIVSLQALRLGLQALESANIRMFQQFARGLPFNHPTVDPLKNAESADLSAHSSNLATSLDYTTMVQRMQGGQGLEVLETLDDVEGRLDLIFLDIYDKATQAFTAAFYVHSNAIALTSSAPGAPLTLLFK